MTYKCLIKMLFSLLLAATISTGCGGDEPGTNTDQNDGGVSDANDDSDASGDVEDDAEIPEGSVFFVIPAEDIFYTNDLVDFEIGVNDDPEDIDLYVDGELLGAVDDDLLYSWSTLDEDEGSYLVQLHYNVDGEAEVAAQERTIVVDRTAPEMIVSTPEASAEEVLAQASITVSFSEPLDPASVNSDTVILEVGGQEMELTLSLANGGSAIKLDFDRSQALTPYDATLTINGVTNLAQNVAEEEVITWNVPAFMEEAILEDPQVLHN